MVTTDERSSLDVAALERLRRLGGDPLVARMIDLFMENSVCRMDAVRAGIGAGDLGAVAQAVHSLKSSAANLGALHLQRTAEEMEIRADQGDAGRVSRGLPELEGALAAARAELARERGAIAP